MMGSNLKTASIQLKLRNDILYRVSIKILVSHNIKIDALLQLHAWTHPLPKLGPAELQFFNPSSIKEVKHPFFARALLMSIWALLNTLERICFCRGG